jgi:hypothetical protein
MELNISILMFLFFLLFLTASIWKIWAFLPNKQLEDDDTTPEVQKALLQCMLKAIQTRKGDVNAQELLQQMREESCYDSKRFWRFNLNKLNHLLQSYYSQNPQTSSISDIYIFNKR